MSEREKLVNEVALDLFRRQHPTPGPEREKAWLMYGADYVSDVTETIAAIEAAGVRLVPVEEKPGQGWLHEAVKDACLRASKNSGGTPPQLLYAPILWAMQDALTALEAAGVRLVPSEPSRHMLLAAHMVESDDIELTEDEHRAMYAAFVAASPYAPPGG